MLGLLLAAGVVTSPPAWLERFPRTPLTISGPAGAEVVVVYKVFGAKGQVACVAPCTLAVPRGAHMSVSAVRDGRGVQLPPTRWVDGKGGYRLVPDVLAGTD